MTKFEKDVYMTLEVVCLIAGSVLIGIEFGARIGLAVGMLAWYMRVQVQ